MILRELEQRLRRLQSAQIRIVAVGKYPVARQTKVADVARYQNDGTENIRPSRFIERAEKAAAGWRDTARREIASYLFEGRENALRRLGVKVADDITVKIDRIDTRRLKGSMKVEVAK